MRDPLQSTEPSSSEKQSDLLLWFALLLSPLAMGINTIVGFIVAHWTTDTARKNVCFLVSAIDFVLCLGAFFISASFYRRLRTLDDVDAIEGRRLFMAKLSMLLAVLAVLLVIAGTIAVITLHPTD
jgi:small neutral amino acid transporter SnatA (MarC family)